ncbi:ABC transporter permease [Candidatus Magnetomonas plexicatena]|uniref:ABC transporter permease n=1 Tax=Candidatus Magnetomonas plexicatena TaxID=2552947 RepID=UPI00110058A1|nr:ABC transporter permease [Nitrospirales bacterium LBB_01]
MKKSFQIIITPERSAAHFFRELYDYRELLVFLSIRDVLVRYKQTFFGIAWAVLRPVLTMAIFTFIFGKLAKMPSHGTPYPVLVFTAMLPWQFFSNTVAESSNSLILNENMVSKVFFPKIIIPTSSVMVSLLDFFISFALLVGMLFYYHIWFNMRIVFLPLFLLLLTLLSLGIGYWLSALNVKYRDFRYVIPFVLQIGLYVTPVGFSSTVVPDKWKLLYSLNPMVGIIEGFRWVLSGSSAELYPMGIYLAISITLLILFTGVWFFNKNESTFADII